MGAYESSANPFNLGASLNILRSLEVSRAPYTWALADDQVVRGGAGVEIAETIEEHPDAAVLFWHYGLVQGRRLNLTKLTDYISLIEEGRFAYDFSDVWSNRVVRTDVARRYVRLDARFSHAEPMLGVQIAALSDGMQVHVRGGSLCDAQPGAASGWSASYVRRFKLDPAIDRGR